MFKDQDKDKDLSSKDKDKDKDFNSNDKDKDKDCIVKDKDQDKDCILVLKESLRTRTRTNITGLNSHRSFDVCKLLDARRVGRCECLLYRVAQKTGPPYLIANVLKIS